MERLLYVFAGRRVRIFFDDFVHIDDEVSLRTSVDIRVKFTRSRQGRPSDPQSCGNMA